MSPLALPGGFILLSVLAYARILPNFFLADDYVLLGKLVTEGFYLSWGPHPGGFFRPLTVLSYWLDQRLWGFSPWGYHLTSLVVHGCNSWLLAVAGRAWLGFFRVPDPAARPLALAAGLLFLVLPCHTEAVAYISGRNDILAAGFGLAALWAGLEYVKRPRGALLAGCLAALACALLSKESAVAVPPLLCGLGALSAWGRLKTGTGRASGPALMLGAALVLAVYLAVRSLVLGTFIGAYGKDVHLHLWSAGVFRNLLIFSLRTFLPALPMDWQPALAAFGPWNAAAVLFGLCSVCLWPFRGLPAPARNEIWLAGSLAAAFLTALVPVLPITPHLFSPEAERLLYLPSGFACIGAMAGLYLLFRPRPVWKWIAAGWCLASALGLCHVNERWVNASRLARQTLESTARQLSQQKLFVLNAPDNYQGALIFRLGFIPGLLLFQKMALFARLQAGLLDPDLVRLQELVVELQRLANGIVPGTVPPQSLQTAMQSLQAEQARLYQLPKIQAFLADSRSFKSMLSVREGFLVVACEIRSQQDQVAVALEPDSIRLTLKAPGAVFHPVADPSPVSPEYLSPQQVRIPLASLPRQGADILYFSNGEMHRLDLDNAGNP